MMVLWLCAAIVAAVFAVMIYSIATFRRKAVASPAMYRHSPFVEVLWAIVPIVIIVGTALPAVKTLLTGEDPAQFEQPLRAHQEHFS